MELTNEFTVEVPIEEAWTILTDVERIAPCMPGAQLREVEGDEYRGVVKVKVGPVTAEYRGKATFLERDEASRRAVLRAEGRESRGQGNASATITALLEPSGTATKVAVTTDLTITGRVAQFGRGVLADVSNKLLGEFVSCLEKTVLAGRDGSLVGEPAMVAATAGGPPGAESVPSSGDGGPVGGEVPSAPAERSPSTSGQAAAPPPAEASVDLLRVAGPAVLKRALPALAGLAVLVLVWRMLHRRHRH